MKETGTVKVGISIGDPNGIGMEVIIKALQDNRILQGITPVVYGSTKIATVHKKTIQANEFNFFKIDDAGKAKFKKANLVNCWNEEITINLGESNSTGGSYAFKSLQAATQDLASGKVDVLVTAPINKHNIQSEDFKFSGHTEYLADFAGSEEVLMFMICEKLRVGVVTGHVPLNEVSGILTKQRIVSKIQMMNQSLQKDFTIHRPKIAVLGLNPHAGEKGLLGSEEKEIIRPAIEMANRSNILAYGPYPADGFFGSGQFKEFDGVLAMYHDQGLIPFKSLAFGSGVNYTAGLPIVRTSPDHGTAYEIAGKNQASADSFRHAIYLARDIFISRKNFKEITSNPLKPQKIDTPAGWEKKRTSDKKELKEPEPKAE